MEHNKEQVSSSISSAKHIHICNCEKKTRHRQRYKVVAIIDFVTCPKNITYNKATVKHKANIRQLWGVVKIRLAARKTPVYSFFVSIVLR